MKIDLNNIELMNQLLRIITTNQGWYTPIITLSFLILLWKNNNNIQNQENNILEIYKIVNNLNKKLLEQDFYKNFLNNINNGIIFSNNSINLAFDPTSYSYSIFKYMFLSYFNNPINNIFICLLNWSVYKYYYSVRINGLNQGFLSNRINSALQRSNLGNLMRLKIFSWIYNEYLRKGTRFFIRF